MSVTPQVPENQRIVGDIIHIETTDDHSPEDGTDPAWTLVGATNDTIELSPNTEVQDSREHADYQMRKDPSSEAWEISFGANMLTGPAQLQALGLLTDNFEESGSVNVLADSGGAIRFTVYADEAAFAAGNIKYQSGTDDYLLVHDGGEINVDDYSTLSIVVHSRRRPVHLGLGGTFDADGGGSGGT